MINSMIRWNIPAQPYTVQPQTNWNEIIKFNKTSLKIELKSTRASVPDAIVGRVRRIRNVAHCHCVNLGVCVRVVGSHFRDQTVIYSSRLCVRRGWQFNLIINEFRAMRMNWLPMKFAVRAVICIQIPSNEPSVMTRIIRFFFVRLFACSTQSAYNHITHRYTHGNSCDECLSWEWMERFSKHHASKSQMLKKLFTVCWVRLLNFSCSGDQYPKPGPTSNSKRTHTHSDELWANINNNGILHRSLFPSIRSTNFVMWFWINIYKLLAPARVCGVRWSSPEQFRVWTLMSASAMPHIRNTWFVQLFNYVLISCIFI